MESIGTTLDTDMGQAEAAVREALAGQGFGVLTEIDVAATLRAKLGVERSPLKILGACNPAFAQRALELDPSLALVLPCNVVLEDLEDGRTRVSVADPRSLLGGGPGGGGPELEALGTEAATALEAAVADLGR